MALLIFALVAIGCGDETSTGAGPEETSGEERLYPRIKGPTREFLVAGGDNAVQTFGEEASATERENASRVIHAWMKARVAGDWATECKHLARDYFEERVLEARTLSKDMDKTCAQSLEYFGKEPPGNTLTGPIDSLRVRDAVVVEGDVEKEAYAQWHGPEKDWVVPMRLEGGAWKVNSGNPLDRNR
ncbi:MAG TPA: hypothetical protein VFM51_10890 [Solirubrobacterales bacterium]|nr:hypothetical protein [Solirubrobacterales bacterium]